MGASTHQSPRQRRSDELAYVARCLTERDRQIVEAVARFGVFTAEHIAEMFFDSLKRAQVRLQRLHALRVLDRFQPYRERWGSSPYHYMLGPNGVAIAGATEDGHPSAGVRSGSRLALGCRRELNQLLAVNSLYACHVSRARRRPDARLEWMTAQEASAWSDRIVAPAAFGVWSEGGRSVEFFVEVDRGGSWTSRFQAALSCYERFANERGRGAWILVLVDGPSRERRVRTALTPRRHVPLATARVGCGHQRWPCGSSEARDVSHLLPLAPVPTSPRAWRYARDARTTSSRRVT